MLIIVNPPIRARTAGERIIVLEAVRPRRIRFTSWGSASRAKEHHPDKRCDEFHRLHPKSVIIEPDGSRCQRFCNMAIGHGPHSSVPGAIHPLPLPFTFGGKKIIV